MKVRDVMTLGVLTIEPDATILKAIRVMLDHRISGLPVVDAAGKPVGIVSEGDLLRREETDTQRKRSRWLAFLAGPGALADDYVRSHARKVEDIMTRDVVSVAEDASLEEVVNLMERHGIKRIPVLRDGKLVGIVSRANLLRVLERAASEVAAPPASDQEIRTLLTSELERQHWAPVGAIEVVALNGAVHLWGTITDERARRAIIVAAENTPGVKSVTDHLAWVDPMSGMVFAAPEISPDRTLVS